MRLSSVFVLYSIAVRQHEGGRSLFATEPFPQPVELFRRNFFFIYFCLATQVFTASSTALDRSPFFPPNLSIVLILNLFSSSLERSTQTRPISITNINSYAGFARVNCVSTAKSRMPCVTIWTIPDSTVVGSIAVGCTAVDSIVANTVADSIVANTVADSTPVDSKTVEDTGAGKTVAVYLHVTIVLLH